MVHSYMNLNDVISSVKFKIFEREPVRYCNGDGKVTFMRPFLMLGKVTFDGNRVNALKRSCKLR